MRLGSALFIAAVLAVAGCGGQRTSTQTPVVAAAEARPAATSSASAAGPRSEAGIEATNKPPVASEATNKPPGASDGLPVTVATAKAHTEGRHYTLDVKAPGSVNVGGHGSLEVVLLATDGYHINDEFPYGLKTTADPAGIVSFDAPQLSREQGTYTKTEARFEAKFTAARAGVAKIGGRMALSVCTKKECIVDKIEVEVPVTVR